MRLHLEREGLGGGRLGQIEKDVERLEGERDARRERADRFDERVAALNLPAVRGETQFAERTRDFAQLAASVEDASSQVQNRRTERQVRLARVEEDGRSLNEELTSLRERRTNLPAQSLALRARLCADTGIEPFVSAVGFVDNETGSYSRLQCLTVEEYRARRRSRLAAELVETR